MATKIVTKNSSTAGAAPTATDLVQGELAVNVADGRLYTEDNAAAIVELGVNPATEITANAGIALPDSQKATFGASDDLQIYHDGSNSYVKDVGTGNLYLDSSDTIIRANGTENSAKFIGNGRVELYYDAVKKFETTSTGIDVTGTATTDGVLSNGGGINDIPLEITHSWGASGTPLIKASNASSEVFRVQRNGSVGINTSSPDAVLEVDGSASTDGILITNPLSGSFYNAKVEFRRDGTSGGAKIQTERASAGGVGLSFNYTASNTAETNGTYSEAMRIDTSGNVGIGCTPNTKLHVASAPNATSGAIAHLRNNSATSSNTSFGGMFFSSSPGVDYSIGKANVNTTTTLSFRNASSGASLMDIDSSGHVGIGTSSPSSYQANADNLVVASSGETGITIASGTSNLGNIHFADGTSGADAYRGFIQYEHTSNYMRFATNATERMRIDSSGNLLVGTTTSRGKLTVESSSGACRAVNVLTGAGTIDAFTFNGGAIGSISTNGVTTSYNTSSDQRLKDNIADADDAGSKIDSIQVRKYDWKADGSHQDYGMIAQELQAVAPEAVSGDADSEEMMGVDYSKLVPMLIKEIQSLRNRVAQLETGE